MPNNLRDPALAQKILSKLVSLAETAARRKGRPPVIMEVCGTHTIAIAKSGLKSLIAGILELRSGPGCPVCVTDQGDIDRMIALTHQPGVVIASFGDMLRVPGTGSSLELERARGARVKLFYSPMEAAAYAAENPGSEVVFLGVGFETTTPAVALSIALAKDKNLKNYAVLSAHKTVAPALEAILSEPELKIDGFILPGHVCAITGRKKFDFVSARYNVPAAVTGFETLDILQSICQLLKEIAAGSASTVNCYKRLVPEEGNNKARLIMEEYFEPADTYWRGFGLIPRSGLRLKEQYSSYDAALRYPLEMPISQPPRECACGDILKGKLSPGECPLFARTCSPSRPHGPCMVSSEGSCAAYYNYEWSVRK
jgi:hydrogenase expression/formation protein HypD